MSEEKLKEIESKIKRVKEDLEDKQKTKDNLQGKLDSLMERLKKEFELNSLDDANTELKVLEKEIEDGQQDVNKQYNTIMEMVGEME